MPTLYVIEPGARIEKEYRRLLVTVDDEVVRSVPLRRVTQVVLGRGVGATTPALRALLREGVSLSLINQWGRLEGMLMSAEAKNIPLRQKQCARAQDAAFCLEISRSIVAGKLRNERNLARRMMRAHPNLVASERVERIQQALAQVQMAESLSELRGLEGAGARAYFAVFRAVLEDAHGFERRQRRPPKDPINAMLSLGYSLLTQNLMTACRVVGLDPYDGFFHSDKYGRPALALDLVEEFRHVIVDSVVMRLVNRNMISGKDFEPGERGGVHLKQKALRVFFQQYEARLQTRVKHPLSDRKFSYQQIFEIQARQLRRCIEGTAEAYKPFLTR